MSHTRNHKKLKKTKKNWVKVYVNTLEGLIRSMLWIAFSTIDWSSSCWNKRNFTFLFTICANSFVHFPWTEATSLKTHLLYTSIYITIQKELLKIENFEKYPNCMLSLLTLINSLFKVLYFNDWKTDKIGKFNYG